MVTAVVMFFVVGISAGIGAAVRRGHRHEREIVNWARKSHQLAQLGERNRIAREMHDVVAHSLSVMVSLADGARVVAKKNPERAAEVIGEVSATGRGALADMRRVIGVLRTGTPQTRFGVPSPNLWRASTKVSDRPEFPFMWSSQVPLFRMTRHSA